MPESDDQRRILGGPSLVLGRAPQFTTALDPVVASESGWGNRLTGRGWMLDPKAGYARAELREPLHFHLLHGIFRFPSDWTFHIGEGKDDGKPSLRLATDDPWTFVSGPLPAGWPARTESWPADTVPDWIPPTTTGP